MDKCLTVKVAEGLEVQRGRDGHWICVELNGKHAAFNIENMLDRYATGRETLLAWIDWQLEASGEAHG